jgi:hypothetical protein
MAAGVPEVRNRNHLLVFYFVLHGKDEVELSQSFVRIVAQQREQAFRHPKLKIIANGEPPALLSRKTRKRLLNQSRLAIADIDPLREATYKCSSIRLLWANMSEEVLVAVEQLNSAGDVAHRKVVPQFMEELARNARTFSDFEPGCGHSVENDSTFLSKSSDSDDFVCNPSCTRI